MAESGIDTSFHLMDQMKTSINLGRERETNSRKGVEFDKFKRSSVHIRSNGSSEIDLSRVPWRMGFDVGQGSVT